MREDLSAVEIQFNEDDASRADQFDIGTYFNQFASKIYRGVLPTRQFDES